MITEVLFNTLDFRLVENWINLKLTKYYWSDYVNSRPAGIPITFFYLKDFDYLFILLKLLNSRKEST